MLELLAYFKAPVPWVTLSDTSWHAEATYRILRPLLFGFLLGLLIHIVFRTPFWASMLFGIGVAVLASLFHFWAWRRG